MHFNKLFALFVQNHFSQADVLRLTGLPAATLQNWSNRGLITPDKIRNGRRLYTGAQIVQLYYASQFTALGNSANFAVIQGAAVFPALVRRVLHEAFKQGVNADGLLELDRIDHSSFAVVIDPAYSDRESAIEAVSWSEISEYLQNRPSAIVVNGSSLVDLVNASTELRPMHRSIAGESPAGVDAGQTESKASDGA